MSSIPVESLGDPFMGYWRCSNCGAIGNFATRRSCNKCGSQDVKEGFWLCNNCVTIGDFETSQHCEKCHSKDVRKIVSPFQTTTNLEILEKNLKPRFAHISTMYGNSSDGCMVSSAILIAISAICYTIYHVTYWLISKIVVHH